MESEFGKPDRANTSKGITTWTYEYDSAGIPPPPRFAQHLALIKRYCSVGVAGGHLVGQAAVSGNMAGVVLATEGMGVATQATGELLNEATQVTSAVLIITFDKSGVVKDYDYSTSTNS